MAATSDNILDNLQVSLLIDWNDSVQNVLRLTNGGCKLMADIEALNVGVGEIGSQSVDTLIHRTTFIGDDEFVAEIDAVVAIGANSVTLDLVDIGGNPVEFFRKDNVMFASDKQIQGIVVSHTPGQIVVEPYAGSTIAQLAASFTGGESVNSLGLHKPYRNSSGVEPIKYFPDIQENYLSLMRDGNDWNRVDLHKARIKWDGTYWEHGMVTRALQRMLKDIERNWLWGIANNDAANDRSSNGGVDYCIRNFGGVVQGFSAAPDQATFQAWLDEVADRKLNSMKMKKMYMGRKLYTHISNNFTAGFIEEREQQGNFSGETNTNIKYYRVGGHDVELVTNLGLLQDRQFDTSATQGNGMTGMKKEWRCYYIDQDPVQLEGGGEVPAIQKMHWGESPYYAAFGKGIGDNPIGGLPMTANAVITPESFGSNVMTMQDRSTVQFMYHGGVHMPTGVYSGIFEPNL